MKICQTDRQPEFTQIDIETSFMTREDFRALMEEMYVQLFKDVLNVELSRPFPRLTYQEAMERYGTDKPDLRFGMEWLIFPIRWSTRLSKFLLVYYNPAVK